MSEYNIKEVSKMFNLPASTLRYYEEMGILTNIPRSASGQRIYLDMHINRLKTICCFKNTSMTISQLQTFFSYESKETEHIDDILNLLNNQKESVAEKIKELQNAHAHILRKLHYYNDIKKSQQEDKPLPDWKDYKYVTFESECSVK